MYVPLSSLRGRRGLVKSSPTSFLTDDDHHDDNDDDDDDDIYNGDDDVNKNHVNSSNSIINK